MAKLFGDKCEVRIATSEAGLATAPVLTQLQSVEWEADPNADAQPKGLGQGRDKEITPGLIDRSGNITRWYNKDSVVASPGTTTFADICDAHITGTDDPTLLFIQVKDIGAGETHLLSNTYGKHHITKPIDGYSEETYDFIFESIEKT